MGLCCAAATFFGMVDINRVYVMYYLGGVGSPTIELHHNRGLWRAWTMGPEGFRSWSDASESLKEAEEAVRQMVTEAEAEGLEPRRTSTAWPSSSHSSS